MDLLAQHRTDRLCVHGPALRLRLLATCAHGDLHWANLTAPELCLLDWELWGMAPAGYDPAVLYCASVLVPGIRDQVRAVFADQLDTPTGRGAQLAAILKLFCLVEDGDDLDIAAPLHRHTRTLIRGHL